jgi:iron complex transport system ATP-binding protein
MVTQQLSPLRVTIDGVTASIDNVPILTGVTMHIGAGSCHGLVGPNGSGKSTLFRAICRSLRPTAGVVLLGGDDLWRHLGARSAATRRAVVTQHSGIDLDYSVRDVVAMGRIPHKRPFERDTAQDRDLVQRALTDVSMAWAADRIVSTLSGGERQRVLVARALAQQAPILVLDEPTNHLDVRAQLDLLDLVGSLGLTIIVALHDLSQAAAVCDTVSVMQGGTVVATGAPREVLTPQLIADVFAVDAHVGTHPITGRPQVSVAPLRSRSTATDLPTAVPTTPKD